MQGIRQDEGIMPYFTSSVTFILLNAGKLDASNEVGTKREWLASRSGKLYAAWHGRYRTDIFAVDKAVARAALKRDGYRL